MEKNNNRGGKKVGEVETRIVQKEKSNFCASPTKPGPIPWEGLEYFLWRSFIEMTPGWPKRLDSMQCSSSAYPLHKLKKIVSLDWASLCSWGNPERAKSWRVSALVVGGNISFLEVGYEQCIFIVTQKSGYILSSYHVFYNKQIPGEFNSQINCWTNFPHLRLPSLYYPDFVLQNQYSLVCYWECVPFQ